MELEQQYQVLLLTATQLRLVAKRLHTVRVLVAMVDQVFHKRLGKIHTLEPMVLLLWVLVRMLVLLGMLLQVNLFLTLRQRMAQRQLVMIRLPMESLRLRLVVVII